MWPWRSSRHEDQFANATVDPQSQEFRGDLWSTLGKMCMVCSKCFVKLKPTNKKSFSALRKPQIVDAATLLQSSEWPPEALTWTWFEAVHWAVGRRSAHRRFLILRSNTSRAFRSRPRKYLQMCLVIVLLAACKKKRRRKRQFSDRRRRHKEAHGCQRFSCAEAKSQAERRNSYT